MKSRLVVLATALAAFCSFATSQAQSKQDSTENRLPGSIQIVRAGEENPMVTIGKSTFYGMATGALLAGAISLAVEGDTEDLTKVFVVSGTFVGFGVGIYHVATRPKPYAAAMLQFNGNGLAKLSLPPPELQWQNGRVHGFTVSLASFSL